VQFGAPGRRPVEGPENVEIPECERPASPTEGEFASARLQDVSIGFVKKIAISSMKASFYERQGAGNADMR
jgi:hypothetical protein